MAGIKSSQEKPSLWAGIKRNLIKAFRDNKTVLDECVLINTRRIYFISIIAIPLHIISILLFVFTKSDDTLWSYGIMMCHLALLVFMVTMLLVSRRFKDRRKPTKGMYVLQYVVMGFILVSGTIFVVFDQLVTTNITPFVLMCIIEGVILLIRPIASLIFFVVSCVAYYFSLTLTITDQQVLLSNRVNGLVAAGIGFFLSCILWRYNCRNIIHMRRIKAQQRQLKQMAYYDPVTDLPYRRLLEKLLKREIALMQRYGHDSVIIILDIDNFKTINDTYGHPVGDNILKKLDELLVNNVRVSDTVARFGGEEFIILMPGTSVEEGFAFAEELRKLIMAKRFIVGSVMLHITSSFGVSSIRDLMGSQTLEDYYYRADKALYLAKQSGKNRVEKACQEVQRFE